MKKIVAFTSIFIILSSSIFVSMPLSAEEIYSPIVLNTGETPETDSETELNSRYDIYVPPSVNQLSEEKIIYNTQEYTNEFINEELVLYTDGTYDINGVDFSESYVENNTINGLASWSGSEATCTGDPSFQKTCKNARAYGSSYDLYMQFYFDYTTSRTGKSSIDRYYNTYVEKITNCWLSSKSISRQAENPTNLYKDVVVFKQNITGGIQQKSLHQLVVTIDHNYITVTKLAS